MEAISNRRSIRSYEPKSVEPEKLKLILEAARLAPSATPRKKLKEIVMHEKWLD